MKERPILFNSDMVRAILADHKTQTRRAVKLRFPFEIEELDDGKLWPWYPDYVTGGDWDGWASCPYGQPGDRLWVRESHWRFTGCEFQGKPWNGFLQAPDLNPYKARCYDDSEVLEPAKNACAVVRMRSIHMPRWASRITLEITAVRVERLQAIRDADWDAEGISFCMEDPDTAAGYAFSEAEHYAIAGVAMYGTPEDHGMRAQFAEQRLYWDENPWVWVVEFKRVAA